ncbi:MAG: flagellar protein FlaG [Lachnospiraceae bacterium]|nr:flagellar protein FlaG [Lachnospiraceae bacterium]
MALEPIGSITSAQVQSQVKIQPVKVENVSLSDENTFSATPKVDENTPAIAKANESDTKGQDYTSEQKPNDNEALRKAVDDMNRKMSNSEVVYGFHDDTNRVTIKIIDRQSKEIIKELPPEKTLDMIAKVWEMAGILVDEKR